MAPRFFKNEKEFRSWLMKNHKKAKEIWVGLHKGVKFKDKRLTQRQATDQAMCFGWSSGVIRGIDAYTYTMKFVPRTARSGWSHLNAKRFRELQKLGLVHRSGAESFRQRDESKSFKKNPRFAPVQQKAFQANAKAWSFFQSQTESYRVYTTWWVISAKRPETREKRFKMLLEDSENQHKLKRILEATAKLQKIYPPGQTPIEAGRNVGPVTGSELRSIGIETVEQFKRMGWEKVFHLIVQHYPHRLNLYMAVGLIALDQDQDWRRLDPELKAEARMLIFDMKRGLR